MDEFMFSIFIILLVLICISPLFVEDGIENFNLQDAFLIDNFITYTKFGTPQYFLIYEFKDNTIKEFNVTSEEYYKHINLTVSDTIKESL